VVRRQHAKGMGYMGIWRSVKKITSVGVRRWGHFGQKYRSLHDSFYILKNMISTNFLTTQKFSKHKLLKGANMRICKWQLSGRKGGGE
jgi:hypothetical protein